MSTPVSPNSTDPDRQNVFAVAKSDFDQKLIVAVHGMGDQTRNDFVQTIARLFARYHALKNKEIVQTRLLPLGAWDGGRETDVDDPAICFEPAEGCEGLKSYAFAEVYWADITRTMEGNGYRLEEATHWARSVVERLAQRHGASTEFGPKQFHLAGFVIEEIAETLALLQKVAMAGKLFKLSKKDVDTVLTQYLCDVQQVGDYQRQREKIRDRFFNRMEKLSEMYPKAEIHLVAHSEGTAVSLFSLLTALCTAGQQEARDLRQARDKQDSIDCGKGNQSRLTFKWVSQVRSFSTMGSPIDKHLHLWPEMWRRFEEKAGWHRIEPKIRWRNYYDYADPVGYELDSAQAKLKAWGCSAFDFDVAKHDHGFRRYAIPGQAHLAYFSDDGLFAHVIEDAVCALSNPVPPPKDKWTGWVSKIIPFALVAGLLFAAVFVLNQALVLPKDGLPTECQRALGNPPTTHGLWGTWALLVGVTALARILRLTRTFGMILLAGVLFAAGIFVFWKWPGQFAPEAGLKAGGCCFSPGDPATTGKIVFIAWSVLAVLAAWVADFWACLKRWRPLWALRILILSGTLFLGLSLIVPRLNEDGGPSAFTLLGGLVGFAVLWWIATLLFDMAFCWFRYINAEKSWINRVWQDPLPPQEQTSTTP